MENNRVSKELLDEILIALNSIPNQATGGERWRTTYQLAAALSRALRVRDSTGRT